MQIGMLGPLEVRADSGEVLEVGGARLRALLILLALEPGRLVTTSRLVDALWAEQVPAGANNALQALISRLRRAVPGIVVTPQPAGYHLVLDPDALDIRRFERLAALGHGQLDGDPATAAATLRTALALWRGPALADVAEAPFAQARIAHLDELRLAAIHDRIEAELRLGASAALVAELESLVVAHPLREPLIGQLMRAQYALGRRGAALVTYQRTRAQLADQLGTDPSPELTDLHTTLLRAEPAPAGATPSHLDTTSARTRTAAAAPADGPTAGPGSATARSGGPTAGLGPATARSGGPTAGLGPATARSGGSIDADHPVGAGNGEREPSLTNLRAELTSFVGRDDELSEVGRRLEGARLTTLTGPGGAGKTRLAIEAARTWLTSMPDGVWLVELAPVTDPGEVTQTALATLGLRDQALLAGGRLHLAVPDDAAEPLRRLVAGLSGKRALLVLDNCEHLLEAAATMADGILRACPDVRIVATSREPLGINGENLWPVQPLALPPADADAATARRYAAVALFADRARAVRPGFAVTAGNVAAIVGVCRALDGMPLAIELAAARLRAMTAEQVATRLDDRFRLLTGGSRTALPRHQTLRAVVDWSWELLGDAERALCRRLSVFTGGATLEAAERVCAGGPVAAIDVFELLSALVDKSLLVTREDGGVARYRMLETIHAYGQERLDEAGERDRIRAAHGAHFLSLAESAVPYLNGREQLDWLDRLSADHDNLHVAVRSAIGAGDGPIAVRLVAALGWYWWLRGYKVEGAELADAALAMPGEIPQEALGVALAIAALLTIDGTRDVARATELFRRAAELAAHLPPPHPPLLRLVTPLYALFGLMESGQRPVRTDVLDTPVDDPDPWIAATARVMRAHLELNFGRQHEQAEHDFRTALGIYRDLGERWGTAFTLSSMAILAAWRGEYATAAGYVEEGLGLIVELGVVEDLIQLRTRLAQLRWLLGDREWAWTELAHAGREARRLGLPEPRYWVANIGAELARLDGDLDRAADLMAEAVEALRHRTVSPQARAMVASAQGYLAAAQGDLDAASGHHAAAVVAAVDSVDSPVIAQILVGVADLAMRRGAVTRAVELLGASVAVRGAPDLSLLDGVRVTAAARAVLGDIEFAEAYQRGLATTADTVAERVGDLALPAPPPVRPDA